MHDPLQALPPQVLPEKPHRWKNTIPNVHYSAYDHGSNFKGLSSKNMLEYSQLKRDSHCRTYLASKSYHVCLAT